MILGFDTATPATTVAVLGDGAYLELRDDPGPGERPRHAERLLALVEDAVERAGGWGGVERLAVGVGPGGFTGLRLGIATGRALAQARGLPVVGVSTLAALASAADASHVLAVLDARRGEVFAAEYRDGRAVLGPLAIAPAALAQRVRGTPLGVGDGSVRFRQELERAGAVIPADGSPAHRVSALATCRLGASRKPAGRDALLPDYRREPDAVPPRPP